MTDQEPKETCGDEHIDKLLDYIFDECPTCGHESKDHTPVGCRFIDGYSVCKCEECRCPDCIRRTHE